MFEIGVRHNGASSLPVDVIGGGRVACGLPCGA